MRVTVGSGIRYDPTDDLAAVRAVVPSSWWRDVEEVRFAKHLHGGVAGWYDDSTIYIAASAKMRDGIRRTLVHELAHHADRDGKLSAPLSAFRHLYRRLHPRATGAGEYLARGAEEFYLGDRSTLRREHLRLYDMLRSL